MHEILNEGVMENAARMGRHLMSRLEQIKTSFPELVAHVRGKGLMVGLELRFDGTELVNTLFSRGVLLNLTNSTVLRWLPPLNIRQEHLDTAIDVVGSTLMEMQKAGKNVTVASASAIR